MTKTRGKRALKIALAVLLALFLLFSAGSLLFIKVSFDDVFSRPKTREYSAYLRYADVEAQYDRETVRFPSGENTLQGYLYGTENRGGLVVISHGLGGTAEDYLPHALWFADRGYQVFCYDNTGCGGSTGDNCVGLNQSVLDLDAALTWLEGEERFAGLPVLLFGHSWGGYAVSAIFHFDHEIAASAAVAGFNDPMEMILEWIEDSMGLMARIESPYIRLYQQLLFGENAGLTAVDALNSTDTPVLLLHGLNDETVSYTGAGTIAYRDGITNPNVEYLTCGGEGQDGHNDLFMSRAASAYLAQANDAYRQLHARYGGELPPDVDREFIESLDPWQTSELDEGFMQAVLAFYRRAA